MQTLLLATRNPHKTREFAEILGGEFKLIDLSGAPTAPEIEETGQTFAANAVLKAVAISQGQPGFVIADDSGLEVDALGGAPGIFSARYAGKNATDRQNIDKLLREIARVSADQRSARFRCVVALARSGRLLGTFEESVEGVIVDPARGRHGFGYDPIFMPTGFQQTLAEMMPSAKNKISHRAKAIAALRRGLRSGTMF
jgi:XTP/dITP diphosphohydrolase